MIDNPDLYGGVIGGGILAYVAQVIWQKWGSTEGKANDALVVQLSERIAAQEARLTTLETGLDEERAARRKAENKVHALEIDNLMLRAELGKHGIQLPPSRMSAE
jgi:hypothetical protein